MDDATSLYDNFGGISAPRQAALLNLSYHLGKPRLSKFKEFNAAVRDERWADAVRHLLKSKYKAQFSSRANEIARKLLQEAV
jgi:hypothetical protein